MEVIGMPGNEWVTPNHPVDAAKSVVETTVCHNIGMALLDNGQRKLNGALISPLQISAFALVSNRRRPMSCGQ